MHTSFSSVLDVSKERGYLKKWKDDADVRLRTVWSFSPLQFYNHPLFWFEYGVAFDSSVVLPVEISSRTSVPPKKCECPQNVG